MILYLNLYQAPERDKSCPGDYEKSSSEAWFVNSNDHAVNTMRATVLAKYFRKFENASKILTEYRLVTAVYFMSIFISLPVREC